MGRRGGQSAAQEPEERAMTSRAFPEHAQEEGGKEGRVDEAEDELKKIVDRVEGLRQISCTDRERDAYDRGDAAHVEVMLVGRARADVALVDVVCEDGV